MLTRKFARKKAHRDHMLRNLAASVLLYEKVETTQAKAKEVRTLIDRSINTAKKNTLAARRDLEGLYFDSNVVKKLFEVLANRFTDRNSGYSRVMRTGNRHGDNAPTSIIMLIQEEKAAKTAQQINTSKKKEELTDGKE